MAHVTHTNVDIYKPLTAINCILVSGLNGDILTVCGIYPPSEDAVITHHT